MLFILALLFLGAGVAVFLWEHTDSLGNLFPSPSSVTVSSTTEDKTSVSDMEKSLFERIKENDKKQWKNSESNQTQNLAEDY